MRLRQFQSTLFHAMLILVAGISLTSCHSWHKISRTAQPLLKDPQLSTATTGISVYEPATNKYWYNYQATHYFVPASNTKILTCYAAMKYLGDSLAGILKFENDTAVFIIPTGDPTLLHPDFPNQPVANFLKGASKKIYTTDNRWADEKLGAGWPWSDYNEDYMAERSPMPVYGNIIQWVKETSAGEPAIIYSMPEVNWNVDFDTARSLLFSVTRKLDENSYTITEGNENKKQIGVPFVTNGIHTTLELLSDTLHQKIRIGGQQAFASFTRNHVVPTAIYSQPTDSVLKIMMHRSDNFFAEQILLMISNKLLGTMNDERIIDTLLKTDLKGLAENPKWVDASGLSRYNLFSPLDLVFVLNKMMNDYGMARIKTIFPTGDEGSLEKYYIGEKSFIFAKTGSLSNVITLSGFLYTKKNKLLIFSVLINNHHANSVYVRRAVEKFVENIRNNF